MQASRRLLAVVVLALAPAVVAHADDEPYRVPGAILRDGRPWPGGRARLVLQHDETWASTGPTVEVVGDAEGAFVCSLAAGPWRIEAAGGWPPGASLRCEVGEGPHPPGHETVWVAYTCTCRSLIHVRPARSRLVDVRPGARTVVDLDLRER